ncbi:MAG: glycosyltransferase family 39 protein [Candidatus Omnitrophota bacterium]
MKSNNLFIILVLFLSAFSLRTFNLERGFFGDESITLSSVSKDLSKIIPSLVKNDMNPPLTSLLLSLWVKINSSEVFIRFYFILFGLGALLIIYLIAIESVGKKVALLALFLGAISPMLISLSQFIRNYIDSAFWMLLSTYFLLLIVKNKGNRLAWFGYFLATLLSIYTFYFSLILVFCQSLYVFIFMYKEKSTIKRWLLIQCCIFLAFIPWIKYLILQFSNSGSSIKLHWEKIGLKVAGINIGIYARNVASLFGMDHYFMVYPEGIKRHFSFLALLAISGLILAGLGFFLFFSLKWLKSEFKNDRKMIWFLPFFSLVPLLISWLGARFMGVLPNARYLAAPHAISVILISYFFYAIIKRHRKFGLILLGSLILLFGLRIPASLTPIYEGNKALDFLRANLREGDGIVMVDRLPGRENLNIPSLNIEKNLYRRDPATSEYYALPEADTNKIKDQISGFNRLWFIRCYGNTEIFGGNRIVYDFLKSCGRTESSSKEFNNIKVILME